MSARGQALQPWGWLVIPAVLALALTLVLASPVRLLGFGLPEPVAPLALAFAWPVVRPTMLGPLILLGLGLFMDFLWGGALGLWPLSLLAVYFATLSARSLIIGQAPAVLAIWYLGGVLLAFFCAYLICALDTHVAPSLVAVGWQAAFTVALFPAVRWLIDRYEDADIRFR